MRDFNTLRAFNSPSWSSVKIYLFDLKGEVESKVATEAEFVRTIVYMTSYSCKLATGWAEKALAGRTDQMDGGWLYFSSRRGQVADRPTAKCKRDGARQ